MLKVSIVCLHHYKYILLPSILIPSLYTYYIPSLYTILYPITLYTYFYYTSVTLQPTHAALLESHAALLLGLSYGSPLCPIQRRLGFWTVDIDFEGFGIKTVHSTNGTLLQNQ